MVRGDPVEDVRKRMDMWKASVEAVQRITRQLVSPSSGFVQL